MGVHNCINRKITKIINNNNNNNNNTLMKIHSNVLDFCKKKRVITTSELAKFLYVSWNTAETYLLELAVEGEVVKIKKEGVNLWLLK